MERSRQHNRENKAKAKAALPQFNEVEANTEKDRDVKTRFQDGERGATIVGETVEAIKRIRTGTIKSADVDVKIHLRDINASVNVSHLEQCPQADPSSLDSPSLRPFRLLWSRQIYSCSSIPDYFFQLNIPFRTRLLARLRQIHIVFRH